MFNGRPWTPDDTKALLQQVSSRKKLDEIARLQKRTVASVESKLKSIAANLYFNEQLPYEEVESRTGIKKDALIVKRIAASINGSPKLDIPTAKPIEPSIAMPIQIISKQSPFSPDTLSSLLISSVSCLLTTT